MAKVDLNIDEEEVNIEFVYKSNKALYPECGKECDIFDYREQRKGHHYMSILSDSK